MDLWNRFGLRTRIFIILGVLLSITAGGGMTMIWYTFRVDSLLASVIQKNIASLKVAKELEIALLNQRGYVSYYLLEGDPVWLQELGKSRQVFDERLQEAKKVEVTQQGREILEKVGFEYQQYASTKDRVVELYRAGEQERGKKLHREVRTHFFDILNLCQKYDDMHNRVLIDALAGSQVQTKRLRITAAVAMSAFVGITAILMVILVVQVLEPIRRLIKEADAIGAPSGKSEDEVAALKHGVHGLIKNVQETHMELERSRDQLLQSEKMATVGKLAAEVAHSIRNPMTSINMRLFSLERALELSPTQEEDFKAISQEMRHLDNIVRNFLEFSRPPRLELQEVNMTGIIDMALQLLEKRLERCGVQVARQRGVCPNIEGDPELLKEVFVNLIVNACDAMPDGGRLTITEEDAVAEHIGRALLIKVSDTGPGIPASLQDKIFQPFFSTKDEGTGLGLSMATRILEEHGGRLEVRSQEDMGATFTITLPAERRKSELYPDRG